MTDHYDQREALYASGNWLKSPAQERVRPSAQRQPLTEFEIGELYFEVLGSQRLRQSDQALLSRFARAIERHHGITGDGQ